MSAQTISNITLDSPKSQNDFVSELKDPQKTTQPNQDVYVNQSPDTDSSAPTHSHSLFKTNTSASPTWPQEIVDALLAETNAQELEALKQTLTQFDHTPTSINNAQACLFLYQENILTHPDVLTLYNRMNNDYGYAFNVNFYLSLYRNAGMVYISYALLTNKDFSHFTQKAVESITSRFLDNPEIDAFLKSMASATNATPQTIEDLDTLSDLTEHFPTDDKPFQRLQKQQKRLQRVCGEMYENNAFVIQTAFVLSPDFVQKYKKLDKVTTFSPDELLNADLITFSLQDHSSQDFFKLVLWLNDNYGVTADMSRLVKLTKQYNDTTTPDLTPTLKTNIDSWINELGITNTDPYYFYTYLKSLEQQNEIREIVTLYPNLTCTNDDLRITTQVLESLLTANDDRIPKPLEVLKDPTFQPFLESLSYDENQETGEMALTLASLMLTAKGVSSCLTYTDAPQTLVRFYNMGVTFESDDFFFGGSSGINALLLKYKEQPQLLDELEAFINAYGLEGSVSIWQAEEFGNFPETYRQLFLKEHIINFVHAIENLFDYRITITDLKIWTRLNENVWNMMADLLRDDQAPDFIQKHYNLFGWQDTGIGKVVTISRFHGALQNGHDWFSALTAIKPYLNDLENLSFTDHDETNTIETLNHPDFHAWIQQIPGNFKFSNITDWATTYADKPEFTVPEFIAFANKLSKAYDKTYFSYQIQNVFNLYLATDKHDFLFDPDVIEFNQTIAREHNEDFKLYNYDEFHALYHNRSALELAKTLTDTYGLNFGASITEFNNIMQGGHYVDTREYVENLQNNGTDTILLAPETKAFYEHLNTTYNITLNRDTLLTFAMIANKPEIRNTMQDPNFELYVKLVTAVLPNYQINLYTLSDIYDCVNDKEILNTIQKLYTMYPIMVVGITGASRELDTIRDLTYNQPMLDKILSPEYQQTVLTLSADHQYNVTLDDLWAVYHITNNEITSQDLYSHEFNVFLSEIFETTSKNLDLATLLLVYEVYKDPENRTLVNSDDFVQFKYFVTNAGMQGFPLSDLKGILLILKNPTLKDKVAELLAQTGVGTMDFLTRNNQSSIALSTIPSLLYLAEHEETIAPYKAVICEKWPQYREHVNDGMAYKEISEMFETPQGFADTLESISLNFEAIYMNDIYYALMHKAPFQTRDAITANLTPFHAPDQDIHRTDSNFFGYHSYNELSEFNDVELNKMQDIVNALQTTPALCAQIGDGIRRDVEVALDSELGGLVENHEPDSTSFRYYAPDSTYFNGAYAITQEATDRMTTAQSMFHQHATSYNSAAFASPSGHLLFRGGDITVAEIYGIDGVVITSLEEGKFAVHFFNERKDVCFLGAYDY